MSKVMLLGAAGLAVSLMAAPVYAQNAGGGGASGTGGVGMAANNSGGAGAGDNNASIGGGAGGVGTSGMANETGAGGSTGAMVGNGRYANVGFGSYSGEQAYIKNDGNNGGGGNAGGVGAGGGGAGNGNNNNWRPSQRNPVLADNGDARASKVVGTAVYNELNQKLGNVNDILLGTNGVFAVIATNNKQVAVPFGDLMFGNATNRGDEKVVIPNETEARLNTLPVFHYNVTNYPGVNANNFGANNFGNGNGGAFSVSGNTPGSVGTVGAGAGDNASGSGAGANVGGVGVGGNAGSGGAGGGGNAGGAGGGAGTGNR